MYVHCAMSPLQVLMSLLLDLPATEDTANILAEHLYDTDNLHPEVQERLDRLLNSWQVCFHVSLPVCLPSCLPSILPAGLFILQLHHVIDFALNLTKSVHSQSI